MIADSFAHWRSQPRALAGHAIRLGQLALRIGGVLLCYFVLYEWLLSIGRLPEGSYFRSVLALELSQNLGVLESGGLAVLLGYLLWTRTLGQRWSDLPNGLRWRPWILLVVVVLTWTYVSYAYNLYYDQWHAVDRLLLLLLSALVLWRPIFLLPYALLVIAIGTQFHYPIGGDSVSEQFAMVRILVLFVAVFWSPLPARYRSAGFAFLVLTLIAASYWWPGLGKLRLLWFTHGQVHLLLPAAYSSGWLGTVPPSTIEWLAELLRSLNPVLVVVTLFAECGALLFLWRRTFSLALLCAWTALHLGIAAVSGIFFWKWILLNLGLFWLLLRDRNSELFPVFTARHFLLSLLLIGGGRFWYDATNLSWYDSPVNYAYRIEAVGESGRTYLLPPRFFAPYEYQFSLGAFGYLNKEPRLTLVYGAVWERDVATALTRVTTAEDLRALEVKRGRIQRDVQRSERMLTFLQDYLRHLNEHGARPGLPVLLQAPSQLLSLPYYPAFEERIVSVAVRQVTSLYRQGRYEEIRETVLHEIEIPAPASPRTLPKRPPAAFHGGGGDILPMRAQFTYRPIGFRRRRVEVPKPPGRLTFARDTSNHTW